MRYLRFLTITLSILLMVIITNEMVYSQKKTINTYILDGTDAYNATLLNGTTLYDFKSFAISEQDHKTTNGHTLKICNKQNNKSYTLGIEQGVYFLGLMGNYILINKGTGNIRKLIVYNILTKEVVFQNSYFDNIKIQDNSLIFKDRVEIEDESLKPGCPQNLLDIGYGIGYSEKLIYHIDKQRLERTGIYKCHYFE